VVLYPVRNDSVVGELKAFLLQESESAIKGITNGLNSDVIACAVKLMTLEELRVVGSKIYNHIPGMFTRISLLFIEIFYYFVCLFVCLFVFFFFFCVF
jgi:ethanolamine ammonia-lyase large subunit